MQWRGPGPGSAKRRKGIYNKIKSDKSQGPHRLQQIQQANWPFAIPQQDQDRSTRWGSSFSFWTLRSQILRSFDYFIWIIFLHHVGGRVWKMRRNREARDTTKTKVQRRSLLLISLNLFAPRWSLRLLSCRWTLDYLSPPRLHRVVSFSASGSTSRFRPETQPRTQPDPNPPNPAVTT